MVELPPLLPCARCVFSFMLPHYFTMYIIPGLCCPDTAGVSMGSCHLVLPVGQLWSDQMSFGPSPPKIYHKVNTDGIPINAKNCLCLADP